MALQKKNREFIRENADLVQSRVCIKIAVITSPSSSRQASGSTLSSFPGRKTMLLMLSPMILIAVTTNYQKFSANLAPLSFHSIFK
jgi:hypothetical protein